MVGFICDAIVGTVDDLLAIRTALDLPRIEWQTRRRFRKGSAALRTLSILDSYPVLTAKRLQERLDVSAPTAFQAIDQLIAARILTERTGYRRNRVFVAAEVLAQINRT